MKNTHISTLVISAILLSGCGVIPFKAGTNTPLTNVSNSQTSFELRDTRAKNKDGVGCSPKKHKDVLVLLALSGGGSRAALLSGLSMIELQKMKILDEVDLISSVSGGSLAAAYYAISEDGNTEEEICGHSTSGRLWNKDTVAELMGKNYLLPWIGNWFWPDNIFLYWFSSYDRTDIMAQTLADNLFDKDIIGIDLTFSDLNPARPNLIINATQGSSNNSSEKKINSFGRPFTFTEEDFKTICSSINDYELSRAVMASATFPGIFNFMTLQNHCKGDGDEKRYIHLFDGGNSDNLGLTSIKDEIFELYQAKKLDYRKIVVILVDAYTDSSGVAETKNDPRGFFDYIVDTNFLTAADSLLAKNRKSLLNQFEDKRFNCESKSPRSKVNEICKDKNSFEELNKNIKEKMEFVHIKFDDIEDSNLKNQLNHIKTNFYLDGSEDKKTELNAQEAIACAVPMLFGHDDKKCDGNGKQYKSSESVKKKWQDVQTIFNTP